MSKTHYREKAPRPVRLGDWLRELREGIGLPLRAVAEATDMDLAHLHKIEQGQRLHDNLVVHGDNLKALKALLPYYHGGVKCIYIDPPYNTGTEAWVYNDNVNSPMMQEWLGKVVDREDLTRHDKWLCMMLPRLKLLRECLDDDGVIAVSCDDNECHRLRSVMDEVFGEECFLGQIVWKTRNTDNRLKS